MAFRITLDGGIKLSRDLASLNAVVAKLREQLDGRAHLDLRLRRHVRDTTRPHIVATLDLQLQTCAVFIHGVSLPSAEWPTWATELASTLHLTPTKENP